MTSGVEEHHLQMEATTNGHRRDWLIYDVGGHRSNVRVQFLDIRLRPPYSKFAATQMDTLF